jgi:hypothetical protein
MKFDREIYVKVETLRDDARDQNYVGQRYSGSMDIRGLRISFNVNRSSGPALATASVKVWNLSKDKRNAIAHFGDRLSVYAGYKNETGAQLIFRGNTTQVDNFYNEPDIVSTFKCSDGDITINNSTIHIAFAAGCRARDVIQLIADQMKLKIISPLPPETVKWDSAYSDGGGARYVMDRACEKAGYDWIVQNEFIVLNKSGESNTKPIAEINSGNGMIGVPEKIFDKRGQYYKESSGFGWRFKTLLSPTLSRFDRVRIKSERAGVDGVFTIYSIQHEGDTHEGNFMSTIEVFKE